MRPPSPSPSPSGRGSKHALALTLSALVAALFLVQVAWPAALQLTHGFSAYYTASRLVREGANVADFYDDDWFHAQTVRRGFKGAEDIYNLNPPTTALLFWPLAALPPREARVAWSGANLLLLGVVLGLLIRSLGGGAVEVALGVLLIAGFQPVREDLRLGQVYVLLLALETLLLRAYLVRRGAVAGVSLGLAIGFKTAGAGLLLLLVARREWRVLCWVGLTFGATVAGGILLLGPDSWLRYVTLVSRFNTHPELAVTAYQSVPGLLLHLFRFDQIWNPAPLLAAPALALILLVTSAVVMLGVTLQFTGLSTQTTSAALKGRRRSNGLKPRSCTASPFACLSRRRRIIVQKRLGPPSSDSHRDRALAFAAWAILDVALSPVSEDYHYTLLLVPIAILLADWRDCRRGRRWLAILLGAIVLIGAPLPFKSPALAAGAWALLAYPKLYGALGLWGLAVRALRSAPERALAGGGARRQPVLAGETP
ncbi:MAG TPA: glycosyltransferase family 87 protein [Chloroflexota bacterium]|nr:glycosyltransferase family 87 protein [Chloroflexota bacterium]